MTDTVEATEVTETESEAPKKRGRKPGSGDRDFNKVNDQQEQLAAYVNANSGLDPVSANQVKAVLALRGDFSQLPEQVAVREQRAAERKAAEQKYAGLSPEQIKAVKAADRAEKHADKLAARAKEEADKAKALREAATGDGASLAAAVEAQAEDATPKKRPSRNR